MGNTPTLPSQPTPPVTVTTDLPGQVDPGNMSSTGMLQPQPTPTYQSPNMGLPSAPQTTPASQDPEIVAGQAHQTWFDHILSTVGSFLGGDKTIHITKSPDGSVRVTHDPSTEGEKWARIAQMALTGAAQGLAHGQGPGGAANAIAAGTMTGAALPQQQLAAANAQANQMNKQQLDAANQALLHQKVFEATWNNRVRPIEWRETQAVRAAEFAEHMNNLGAIPIAENLENPGDVATYGAVNPDAVDGHLGKPGSPQLVTYPNINGTGVSAWKIPPDKGKQMYDQPWKFEIDQLDPSSPTGIKTTPHTIDPNTISNNEHATQEMALFTHNDTVRKQAADIAKGIREGMPKTGPEATIQGNLPGTPPDVAASYLRSAGQINQAQINKAAAGRAPAPGTEEGYQAIAADLNGPNPRLDISQIRTRKDWPQIYGAARQYAIDNGLQPFDPATASAKYKARTQAISDFTDKKEADQIQSLNNFFGHTQDLMDVTRSMRNPTDMPILNSAINKLDTDFAGDPRVPIIKSKINVVRKEYQAFLENNRALHNEDIAEGNEMMNNNMSLAQIEGAARSFAQAAITRAATTAQRAHTAGFDEIVPSILNSNSRRTIANLGLQDHLNNVWRDVGPTSTGQAQPGPAQQTPQVPPGAVIGRDKTTGKPLGYQLNGKWVSF